MVKNINAMRYLIITTDQDGKQIAFLTNYYEFENHYTPGMVVIDSAKAKVSFDGQTWEEIQEDHF